MCEGRALAVLGAPAHGTGKLIPRPQAELVNDFRTDVNVVLGGREPRLWTSDETGATTQDVENTQGLTDAIG